MSRIRKGARVTWSWGRGQAEGVVRELYERKTSKTLKGEEITRNGTPDDPALLIEQEDGDQVLKLASEVEAKR